MAGLDDIDETTPAGSASPAEGDNQIRALKAKVKEFGGEQHHGGGEHKFPSGTVTNRPVAGKAGNFYILTAPGVANELQYDNGASWETITSNQDAIDALADIAAHTAANPIDHPNGSVTSAILAVGVILKKHLDGSSDATSLEALVDGSNADTFHTHTTAPGANSVTEAMIDWANAGGISQNVILDKELYSTVHGAAFTTVHTHRIYVPLNANFLEYEADIYSTTGEMVSMRLKLDATVGTTISTTGLSYGWAGAATIDVSAVSGWQSIEVQLSDNNTSADIYIDKVVARFR